MNNETAIAVTESREVAMVNDLQQINILDPVQTKAILALSEMISKSELIPVHFRNKPADCFIALFRANKLGFRDPFGFMEQTYVVGGKLAFQGKIVLSAINSSGRLVGPLMFKYEGEPKTMARFCTATGRLKENGIEVSQRISLQDAKDSGWYDKPGSLWPKIPDRMLMWRAAKWLGDMYFPDLMLGVYEVNELRDAEESPEVATPPKSLFTQSIPVSIAVPVEPLQMSQVQPVQNIDVTPAVNTPVNPAVNPTRETMLAVLLEEFKGDEMLADRFFAAKAWIKAGDPTPTMSTENLERAVKNLPELMKVFRAWKMKNVPASVSATTGGAA